MTEYAILLMAVLVGAASANVIFLPALNSIYALVAIVVSLPIP